MMQEWVQQALKEMGQLDCEPAQCKLILKQIKSVAKRGEGQIDDVFEAVWEGLQRNTSMSRLASLMVCDELFARSKHFRQRLTDDFSAFIEHTVAPGKSLPAPKKAAVRLREAALQSLQDWTTRFGDFYVQLSVACKYLQGAGILQAEEVAICTDPADRDTLENSAAARAPAQPISEAVKEIDDAAAALRVCMQCMTALLSLLGRTAPASLQHALQAPTDAENPTTAVSPRAEARDATGHYSGAQPVAGPARLQAAAEDSMHGGDESEYMDSVANPAADRAAAAGSGHPDEELQFEDAQWDDGGLEAVAWDRHRHSEWIAVPEATAGAPAQPQQGELPRKVRRAVMQALRKGQRSIQVVHLPRILSLTSGAAGAGTAAPTHDVSAALSHKSELQRSQLHASNLQDAAQELLGLLSSIPELQEGDNAEETAPASAEPDVPRKRILRGRNERIWPEQPPPHAEVCPDPAAPNLADPYTISAGQAPQCNSATHIPRSVSTHSAVAAGGEAKSCTLKGAASGGPQSRVGQGHPLKQPQPSGNQPTTMSRDALQRIAKKAPILPAGDYLHLWDSYEAQVAFIKQHMQQGQVYNHWGRVEEDVQLDPKQVEDMLAMRAVFHDTLATNAEAQAHHTEQQSQTNVASKGVSGVKKLGVREVQKQGDAGSGKAVGGKTASAAGGGCAEEMADSVGWAQTDAELRVAAREHNRGVLARAGMAQLGQSGCIGLDGESAGEGSRAKKRQRKAEKGSLEKLRAKMRQMSRK